MGIVGISWLDEPHNRNIGGRLDSLGPHKGRRLSPQDRPGYMHRRRRSIE